MGDDRVARILFYGNEPLQAHVCIMPKGNIPPGTVAYCEDCGRYWRLDKYKSEHSRSVPGSVKLIPVWYELGMFGTWWHVRRRGTPHVDPSSNSTRRR